MVFLAFFPLQRQSQTCAIRRNADFPIAREPNTADLAQRSQIEFAPAIIEFACSATLAFVVYHVNDIEFVGHSSYQRVRRFHSLFADVLIVVCPT